MAHPDCPLCTDPTFDYSAAVRAFLSPEGFGACGGHVRAVLRFAKQAGWELGAEAEEALRA